MIGVAIVVCFFVADTLLLSLFLDGYFVVIVTRADALPPVSLWSPLSGRCFVAESVMAPHPRILCRFDDRCLRRMLCRCATVQVDIGRRGLFSSGCFAAVVVPAPLVDALPPRLPGHPRADTLSPMLLEACLVAFEVPLHC